MLCLLVPFRFTSGTSKRRGFYRFSLLFFFSFLSEKNNVVFFLYLFLCLKSYFFVFAASVVRLCRARASSSCMQRFHMHTGSDRTLFICFAVFFFVSLFLLIRSIPMLYSHPVRQRGSVRFYYTKMYQLHVHIFVRLQFKNVITSCSFLRSLFAALDFIFSVFLPFVLLAHTMV